VTAQTLTDIIIGCENYLGWKPASFPKVKMWQARMAEVGRLQTAIDATPHGASIEHLALALEYSWRRRLPIKHPAALLGRIDDALALAYTPPTPSAIDVEVMAAVGWEQLTDDDQSLRWIHRLTRAVGPARVEVLIEWSVDGRG